MYSYDEIPEASSGLWTVVRDEERDCLALYHEGERQIWMATEQVEIDEQQRFLEKARGKVLIAGLGLGVAPVLADEKRGVTQIDVVEIDNDIIKLVWEHIQTRKMNLIRGDICEVLASRATKYDVIYCDLHLR